MITGAEVSGAEAWRRQLLALYTQLTPFPALISPGSGYNQGGGSSYGQGGGGYGGGGGGGGDTRPGDWCVLWTRNRARVVS